jgi:hypothetical protein
VASGGAAGGGIIIVVAGNAITTGGALLAYGATANTTVANDGSGGGGAGGSILVYSNNGVTGNVTALAYGGGGGGNELSGGPSHGPGGGGGGGVIYSNGTLYSTSTVKGGGAGTTAGQTTNYGATGGSAGSMTTNMTSNSLTSFAVSCYVLPVSFLDVKAAYAADGAVKVQWDVAREINTIDYVVERSTDGANFTGVGTVAYKQADGVNNSYQYLDGSAPATGGTLYYRIREEEADSGFRYSRIVSVDPGSTSADLSVYPNPTRGQLTVTFNSASATTVSLRLFDLGGTLLRAQQYTAHAGQNTTQFDGMEKLPEGVYILQWFDQLNSRQVKIFLHR